MSMLKTYRTKDLVKLIHNLDSSVKKILLSEFPEGSNYVIKNTLLTNPKSSWWREIFEERKFFISEIHERKDSFHFSNTPLVTHLAIINLSDMDRVILTEDQWKLIEALTGRIDNKSNE